ncbi:MAG: hypothetical protein ACFFAQ_08340 [Promethearchaeota archaeon]
MNSQLLEKKVEGLLENILKPEESENKRRIQRIKFRLLSKLVADLFDNKDSRECFHNISNLIILMLNLYKDTFPVDIFLNKEKEREVKSTTKHKQILKQEFLMKDNFRR